ncbi:hypothetical protein SNK05_004045 [Fusarium graminearum]
MQACLIIAGPCKPSSITSIGHYSSITSADTATIPSEASTISGDVTTSVIAEAISSTTRDESYDDSTTSAVSTATTLSAATTTTILPELSGTETLSGTQTTTFLPEEPTSTALAISTTSVEPPLGTTLTAVFIDGGYEKEAWLPMDPSAYVSITSNEDTESAGALFGLEAGTSRLYAILPSGEKRYAATCVQCSGGSFAFYTEEERTAGYFVFWAICTEGENRYLSCTSENGVSNSYPHMYFYEVEGNYFQTRYPDRWGRAAVEFRLG